MHKLLPLHDDLGGAVAIRALHLQHGLAFAIATQALVRDRRTLDVAAQPLKFLVLVRAAAFLSRKPVMTRCAMLSTGMSSSGW